MRSLLWIGSIAGVLLIVVNALLPANQYSFDSLLIGVALVAIGLIGLDVTRERV